MPIQLTEHFSLKELTVTDNEALREANRDITRGQIDKLTQVAQLLEACRAILGVPIRVHSGYRCPELNFIIPGSAAKSQHMLCEAADFDGIGVTVNDAFNALYSAAKEGKFKFGQLIVERASRYGSVAEWVHLSLGLPFRDQARCGEVMKMATDLSTGRPMYTRIDLIPQGNAGK